MSGYSLEQARVLVVDGDRNMRNVVSMVLRTLGVRSVAEATDGGEAFDVLRSSPADIIICDRCTRPVDGLAFVRMVRNATDSPNPFAAVILQAVGLAPQHIAEARAAGVHDVLGKPVSAKALYASIRAIIEYPRPFIRTPDYFGPNHRWQQTDFKGEDQRRTPPRATDMDALGQASADSLAVLTPQEIRALLYDGDDNDALFAPPAPEQIPSDAVWNSSEAEGFNREPLLIPVPPEYHLQVTYSPQGIDESAVLAAEAVIKGFRGDYLSWVRKDLSRLQTCFDEALASSRDGRGGAMRAVFDAAYQMAGQGGCFDYPLISLIGAQLCRFIDDRTVFGEADMRAVRLHIDAMRVVVAERLEGDGGHNRHALIKGLRGILGKIVKKDDGWMSSAFTDSMMADRRKRLRFPTW
ncbi:MAG TPA: response regulator [Telmatospirillum sp.]|nr:response regulator [Telmatospirillum sp.]